MRMQRRRGRKRRRSGKEIGGERRKNKEGVGGIIFHTSSSKWILNVKGKHPKDNTGKKNPGDIKFCSEFKI